MLFVKSPSGVSCLTASLNKRTTVKLWRQNALGILDAGKFRNNIEFEFRDEERNLF